MSDSLLASASRRPFSRAAMVTGRPAKPTTPFTTTSASATSRSASGPATTSVPGGTRSASLAARVSSAMATTFGRTALACSASTSTERAAPMAVTSYAPCDAATTSSVCVPMDPVDPSTATVVIDGSEDDDACEVVGRRQAEQQGVEAVEQAAVAGEHRTHVLDAEVALEHRLA